MRQRSLGSTNAGVTSNTEFDAKLLRNGEPTTESLPQHVTGITRPVDESRVHHIPPLLHLLDTLLGHAQDITLRRGVPEVGLAEVNFAARLITLKPGLTTGQLHVALTHELVHLLRGPAVVGHEAREEHVVHSAVARMLAPRHALPAMLEAADPHQVAHDLTIDPYTARLAIALAQDDTEAVA